MTEMIRRYEKNIGKRIILAAIILIAGAIFCVSFAEEAEAAGGSAVVYTDTSYSGVEDGTSAKPYADFEDAVANVADGGIIYIKSGGAFLNTQEITGSNNGQPAFVINKDVTIRPVSDTGSATMDVRAAGILLGGDVTFENIELDFGNGYHDAIWANGHSLTLRNVSRTNGARDIDLFAGGLYSRDVLAVEPESGSDAVITIEVNSKYTAKSDFGNIYAGGMNTTYNGNAEINIITDDVNKLSLGTESSDPDGSDYPATIYSCGAQETYVNTDDFFNMAEPAPPTASSDYFKTEGDVNINLTNYALTLIDGRTGGSKDASVSYGDSKGYTTQKMTLKSIGAISVNDIGNLKPASGSSFSGEADLSIAEGAILDLSNFDPTVTVNDFVGGGTLILGQEQAVTINGSAKGNTKVGIGSVFNDLSQIKAKVNHSYISVPNAAVSGDEFTFLEDKFYSGETPVYAQNKKGWLLASGTDEDGTDEGEPIVISEISIESSCSVGSGNSGVVVPLSVKYEKRPDDYTGLEYIPITVSMNGIAVERVYDEDWGLYSYFTGADSSKLDMMFALYTETDERFVIEGVEDVAFTVPDGEYNFTITIPAANMLDGKERVLTTMVTVGDSGSAPGDDDFSLSAPTAETNLIYTGEKQTGILEGEGYTLTGHQATDAGDYEATAILKEGYKWSDGTTASKTIMWSIGQARLDGSDASAVITLENKEYTYTGSEIKPAVTSVRLGDKALGPETDYTVEYSNNTDVGTDAKVIITGKGNYTGTASATFTIKEAGSVPTPEPDPEEPTLEQVQTTAKSELAAYAQAKQNEYVYREEQKKEIEAAISTGNTAIDAAKEVEGVAAALAAAKSDIDKIKTDAQLDAEEAEAAATALAQAKADAKSELAGYVKETDYREAEWAEVQAAINAGNTDIDAAEDAEGVAAALAAAKADIDTIKKASEFESEDPEDPECSHSYTKQDAKQEALKSAATCTTAAIYYKRCDKCDEISTSTSDTFTYGSPIGHKHGAYATTKKAGFGVAGTQTATCSVCKTHKLTKSIPAVSTPALSATSYTFNNKTKKPSVTVKDVTGKTMTFSASYASGRKNVGKYAVTVTLTGANHSGTHTAYFNINPKGVKLSKLSKAKKSFTAKWKKPSSTYRKQMTGYQIRYSTSSKMTKAKTVTVKSAKSTSKKIKKLKSKKKYYVQIRTYKTVKGVKYYSGWSAKKSVKTK